MAVLSLGSAILLWARPVPGSVLSLVLVLEALSGLWAFSASAIHFAKGRYGKGVLGLIGLSFLALVFVLLALPGIFKHAEERAKDSSGCLEQQQWQPGQTVQSFGIFHNDAEKLTLKVCVAGRGLLAFSLEKDGRELFRTAIPGTVPGLEKNSDAIASHVSVFQKWGMAWEDRVLWVYTGDLGCFSLRPDQSGAYHLKIEDCERPAKGAAKTVLGKIYLDTR